MSPLLSFYRNTGTDHAGRTLADIRAFDHGELESHHDYIQWLFPLPEGSGVLPQAPRLTAADIASFRSDTSLRIELLRSFDQLLDFYGLERREGPSVVPAGNFAERIPDWLTVGNHNFLRLTRIMRSLTLLGCGAEASALHGCLVEIVGQLPGVVSSRTLEFWAQAVG